MGNESPVRQWKASISCYRNIIALKFSTDEENMRALEILCSRLYDMPYTAPAERTLIIPAEAENEFTGLSYNRLKASWASDYQASYNRK